MLWSRGIRTEKEAERFFHPRYPQDLGNPLGIKGMKECLVRIMGAAKNNERVLVYGDYDVDGVCGAIILKSLLKRIGLQSVDVYLPYREKEGYGLNEPALRSFLLQNIKLIITVDCGVSNYKEIMLAKKLGFDVIVADHHRPPLKLPPADVIIDLYQKGDRYPFKDFCGAGVAFKIMQAAVEDPALQKIGNLSWGWAESFLDLTALATIADMVSLLGENRVLTTAGLRHINLTKRPGLKALIQKTASAYGRRIKDGGYLKAEDVAYLLAPPLNAAGRMDHASGAYKILISEDEKEAQDLADLLVSQNGEKQKIIGRMMREVERKIKKVDLKKEFVIFEGASLWPHSLAGVVAGRVAEKYWRPVHLYRKDVKTSIGHCRTIPGYDLVKSMTKCKSFLIKFGGHPMAGGWTCENKNLSRLKRCLVQYAKEVFPNGLPAKPLLVDMEITPAEVRKDLLQKIEQMQPFGVKNERPNFLIKNLTLTDFESIGKGGRHLCLQLAGEEQILKGIWFNNGRQIKAMAKGAKLDIVCKLEKDDRNEKEVLLRIVDVESHGN